MGVPVVNVRVSLSIVELVEAYSRGVGQPFSRIIAVA
jgi:hypothetical protein